MTRTVALVVVLALAVVGCGPAAVVSPSPTAGQTATVAPTSTTAPSAPPTEPVPSPTPAGSAACETLPQNGFVPSDRLTDVELIHASDRDVVRFSFGGNSLTAVGPATGTLTVASPPFTEAASGSPIDLHGQHALQIVFKNMSVQNDAGEETFTGQHDIEAVGSSVIVRHAVIFDESEGRIGWYIGYDGSGCVSLTRDGADILLAVAAGPGS